MLNETIPRFHRDFLSLCSLKTIHRILEYVSPKDLITASGVSKTWNQILNSPELWYALYDSIGLSSMAKVFYIPHGGVVSNVNLFSSTYNWYLFGFILTHLGHMVYSPIAPFRHIALVYYQ